MGRQRLNKRCLFERSGVILEWMGRYTVISISLICGLLASAGCGKRHVAGTGPGLSPGCVVLAGAESQPDTIRIALAGNIDPRNAPVPRNDSERILFSHLYETLITIDCEGEAHPGLAAEWHDGDGGKRWTFRLRRDARFWDGSPVTSRDIVDCWQRAEIEPFIWEAGVDSVAAAGENTVNIYFANQREELPRELSAPPFAVAKMKSRWPLGSTPGSINIEPMYSSLMYRRPLTVTPVSGPGGPVLVFLEPGSSTTFDSRDLLEGQADVLITRDPDVIEYASARPHLETIPLPWLRTYVLLSTTRVLEIRLGDSPAGLDRQFMDDLARDAVHGIARGHEATDWWTKINWCAAMAEGAGWNEFSAPYIHVPNSDGSRRIVFDENDPVARGIAERIVALSAAGPGSSHAEAKLAAAVPELAEGTVGLSAAGITKTELAVSLKDGDDFAYIIWLPLHPSDPCNGIMQLVNRVNWLSHLGDDFAGALLPLVDTRSCAIVRRGTAGLSIDWYGNIYISGSLARPSMPPPGR